MKRAVAVGRLITQKRKVGFMITLNKFTKEVSQFCTQLKTLIFLIIFLDAYFKESFRLYNFYIITVRPNY